MSQFRYIDVQNFYMPYSSYLIPLLTHTLLLQNTSQLCATVYISPAKQWVPVTLNEVYVVLTLFLLLGTITKPTLNSYFSTKRILSTPAFPGIISRDRFQPIYKFFHFNDNNKKDNYQGHTRLFNIFPVIQHLKKKFQNLF